MNAKYLLPLLALPLLAACAPEMESTVYLTDVAAAVEGNAAVSVPALLRIPQQGEEECNKGLADLIEKLKALAPVTGKGQCISKDQDGSSTQLAEIETALQIIPAGGTFDPVNLFALEVATTDDGSYDLTLKMLKPVSELVTALSADSGMQTDFTPTQFIVTLNNDTAGPVDLLPNHVFVDGKPNLPDPQTPVTLQRRGTATILFSDVASSHVEQGNSYWFVTVSPAS